MIASDREAEQEEITKKSSARLNRIHRRQWKRRLQIRAEKIKRQIQIENRFHNAMNEMRATGDHYRQSYRHWILYQMFTLFDYETGFHAIHDKTAYQSWLLANGFEHRKNG